MSLEDVFGTQPAANHLELIEEMNDNHRSMMRCLKWALIYFAVAFASFVLYKAAQGTVVGVLLFFAFLVAISVATVSACAFIMAALEQRTLKKSYYES